MRGNTLVSTSGHGGGARQIRVTFDGGYSSCSANVILGRSGGGKVMMTNLVSGKRMEILSNTTSGATCSLRSGNVFGN
jgi:hypothetical protein